MSNLTDKPTPGVNGKEVLVSLEDNRPSEKLIVPVGELKIEHGIFGEWSGGGGGNDYFWGLGELRQRFYL